MMMVSFSAGETLSTTLRVWARNLISFTVLAALVHAPVLAYQLVALGGDLTVSSLARMGIIATIGSYAANILLIAAITYGVVMELRGQHASFGQSIAVGIGRFFPALGVFLMISLIVGGVLAACGFFGALLGPLMLVTIPVGAIFAIILYMQLFVAVPASVLERPGIMGALRRSRELTDGHKGAIFAMWLLTIIVSALAQWILQKVTIGDLEVGDQFASKLKIGTIAEFVLALLTGSFSAVLSAVTYYFLRNEREGIGADELARVFE